jgi:hypothetical protein
MSFRMCDFVSSVTIKTKAAKSERQPRNCKTANAALSLCGHKAERLRPKSTDAVTRHTIFLIEEKPCGCLT